LLKVEVIAILARMPAKDLFVAYFLSQGVTIERFCLIDHAILTPSVRADVIAHGVLKKFPTKEGKVFFAGQIFQIEACF
jgi:hypothetical protein